MEKDNKRSKQIKQAKILRLFRRLHRISAVYLLFFFLVMTVSGILLAWKKNSNGLILAKTYKGTSANLAEWLPIDSLHKIACQLLHDSVSPTLSLDLSKIDLRQQKGSVKFIFSDHFWGIQLDGATGELLHIERRNADLIEEIHDGSILDTLLKTKGEPLKIIYSTIIGLAWLILIATGFWLWYGPKKMAKKRKQRLKLKK